MYNLSFNANKRIFFLLFACLTVVLTPRAMAVPNNPTVDSIDILTNLAFKNMTQDSKVALKYANEALVLAKKESASKKVQCVVTISRIYNRNLNPTMALQNLESVKHLENQAADTIRMSFYDACADAYDRLANYPKAIEYYQKELELAHKNHLLDREANVYNGLGEVYGALSEYSKEIEYYLKELAIEEKMGDWSAVGLTLRNISGVHVQNRDYEMAKKMIFRAIDLDKRTKDSFELSAAFFNYGKILMTEKKIDEALKTFQEILPMLKTNNEYRKVVYCWAYIGTAFAGMNKLDSAEYYFNLCLKDENAVEFKIRPRFYTQLGYFYRKKGDNQNAILAYQKSLASAKLAGYKEFLQIANWSLSELYSLTGDLQKSNTCLKMAYLYQDSIKQEELKVNLSEAQYKYDFEKSEKEAQLYKLNQGKIIGSGLAMVFFLLVMVLIYILKTRKKTNLALLQKNEQIELQNRRLAESNEILQQLAYVSAHDLKEPLRSISGFINIIQKRYVSQLPPEAHEYMSFVTTGVKRMESLLAALLHYSTVALQDQQLMQNTAILEVIQEVEKTMQPFILEKKAVIRYPSVMPTLNMNRLHLTQLLENLLSNSIKFNEKTPEIKIDFRIKNDDFILSVKDNGIGLKAEYGNKIFRLFQKLERTEGQEDTGIGLSLCKNIVDKYNGRIWFDSTVGQGTTFYISLPKNTLKSKDIKLEKMLSEV